MNNPEYSKETIVGFEEEKVNLILSEIMGKVDDYAHDMDAAMQVANRFRIALIPPSPENGDNRWLACTIHGMLLLRTITLDVKTCCYHWNPALAISKAALLYHYGLPENRCKNTKKLHE